MAKKTAAVPVTSSTSVAVAERLGVADSTIRKHCARLDVPTFAGRYQITPEVEAKIAAALQRAGKRGPKPGSRRADAGANSADAV